MTSSASRLQIPLLIAAAGAVVILLGFFSTIVELGGVVAIVSGTLIAAASKETQVGPEIAGVHWWRLLAAGAATSVVALPLSLALETIGGLLLGIGGALVVVAVAFGYPR